MKASPAPQEEGGGEGLKVGCACPQATAGKAGAGFRTESKASAISVFFPCKLEDPPEGEGSVRPQIFCESYEL